MDERPNDDSEPPPEEIEMSVEEALGRPMAPGRDGAAERVNALEKRIEYLTRQIAYLVERPEDPGVRTTITIRRRELAAAQRQLAEWKRQVEGRN